MGTDTATPASTGAAPVTATAAPPGSQVAAPTDHATPPPWTPVDAAALAEMIQPSRTALVVVDAQVDFVSPHGAMARLGLDLAPLAAPLERVQALLEAARAAEAQVVLLRVVTRPETDPPAVKLRLARSGVPAEALDICRADTPGAGYFGIAPAAADLQIEKLLYSGFAGTTLDAQLRAAGVDTLVVAGFTTECCVDCTVRDAFHLGHACFVVEDACAAYARHLHVHTLEVLALNCALIVDTSAVLAAWGGRRDRAADDSRGAGADAAGAGTSAGAGAGPSAALGDTAGRERSRR